jgi:ketosteroid isomerase-like protein
VQGNLELARRAYEAFAGKDYEAALACGDPEIVYEFVGRFAEGNEYRGPEAILQLWSQLDEIFLDWTSKPEEYIDLGDRVLVLARETGVGRTSELPFEEKLGHLMTFRDGLIVRFQVFGSWTRALRAVGIGQPESPRSREVD